MITIKHVYCTPTQIEYTDNTKEVRMIEYYTESMDNIAEHVCDMLVKHNFYSADVLDRNTGEMLIIIDRTF